MELAKIRNKAKIQEALVPEEGYSNQDGELFSDQIEPLLPEPLQVADDLFKPEPPADSFFKSVSPKTPEHAVPFDPLSLVLAGREHDRLASDNIASSEPDKEVISSDSPVMFLEEFLCFNLANEEYGVNIMEIKEIIKLRELTDVPRTPSFIEGVISLRGVIVPVFNMRKRFGISSGFDKVQERIIIVRYADGLHGLRVDRVTDVVKLPMDLREGVPAILEGVAREFVSGIGRTGKRMIILLDISRVVDTSLGEVY